MKKSVKILVGALIVGAVGMAGMGMMQEDSVAETEVVKGEQAIPVTVVEPIQGEIVETLFTIGEVVPDQVYQVNALASGEVEEVFFEVGDAVEAGQVMFTVDRETVDIDRHSKTEQLGNSLTQAETAMKDAEKTYRDQLKLNENGAVSDNDLNRAKMAYDNAVITYENALSNYNSTVAQLNKNIENYVITSPVDGIVTAKNIEVGSYATNQNGYTVVVKDQMKIKSSISSKYVNQVAVGQEVEVYVNTLDEVMTGEVVSVSYLANKGSYPIEIIIKDAHENLQAGMFAELTIQVDQQDDALILPKSTVMNDDTGSYVYVVEDGQAKRLDVEESIENGDQVSVTGSLTSDMLVVLEGKEYLDDGKKIMVQ